MDRKPKTALLLGTFTDDSNKIVKNHFTLTETAKIFDFNLKGVLKTSLIKDGPFNADKNVKILNFRDPMMAHYTAKYDGIYVVNLGTAKEAKGLENVGSKFRNTSKRVADAIRFIFSQKYEAILIESCDQPQIVGSSVAFALHLVRTLEVPQKVLVQYYDEFNLGGRSHFEKGRILAEGQIAAHSLMKSSSVAEFVDRTKSLLEDTCVVITERDQYWIQENNMSALLSVSTPPSSPRILELVLNRPQTKNKPLLLVSKGTPFEDCVLGGKPKFDDAPRRNGMGGASCIVGALHALSRTQELVNVHCIVALVWTEQNRRKVERGSLVQAMNGISIEIESPEAESRLVMADMLAYAGTLDSCGVVDITTMSSNIDTMVGNSFSVFFTTHQHLKRSLLAASESSGDKVWQLPLVRHFRAALATSGHATLSNVGSEPHRAVAFKSVSFLREFVDESRPWMHVDVSGVSVSRCRRNVLEDTLTGRPTRLVAEFCVRFFQP